jgi:protein deglycase
VEILIILANGFEEIEAIASIDILRRGKARVTIAGVGSININGSQGLKVTTDITVDEAVKNEYAVVILPGGEPGTTNLQNSALVKQILNKHYEANKYIAAICAAPRILNNLGFLNGVKATSYPGTKSLMNNCVYVEKAVVVDGQFITSRGPGTAMAFAYTILKVLNKSDLSDKLQKSMQF